LNSKAAATDYTLACSNRKTLTIHIRDGRVEVRAPHRATVCEIEDFLAAKEAWIAAKIVRSVERAKQREAFSLDYDDKVLYRCRGCASRFIMQSHYCNDR